MQIDKSLHFFFWEERSGEIFFGTLVKRMEESDKRER